MKSRFPVSIAMVFLSLAITAATIAATGCNKAVDDSQIATQVQGKLFSDPAIQSKQITVQSAGGVVTLSGIVNSEGERAAAGAQAAAVEGVKTVVNNLAVQAAQAAPVEQERVSAPAASYKPRPSHPSARNRSLPSSATSSTPAPAPVVAAAPAMATGPVMPATPAVPPPPQKVTVQSGTTLSVRLTENLDTETAQPGQSFHASLDSPLAVDGEVAIPAGYDVQGHVVDVKSAGKFAGRSEISLQLDRIQVGQKFYNIQTSQYHRQGSSRGVNTAEKVGAGAAIGAIIGGLAGGGKGAGIGAAAGGGLGGGVQAATKGQQIKLPAETVLTFELQAPLTVVPTSEGPNSRRQKLETPNNQ